MFGTKHILGSVTSSMPDNTKHLAVISPNRVEDNRLVTSSVWFIRDTPVGHLSRCPTQKPRYVRFLDHVIFTTRQWPIDICVLASEIQIKRKF